MRPCRHPRDPGGMAMTSTDQLAATPLTNGPPTPVDPVRRTTGLHNPVRISRIGSDRLEVLIRPVDGCRELRALVDRLERLIGAGYDAIDVVFEPTHHRAPQPERLADLSDAPLHPRDGA